MNSLFDCIFHFRNASVADQVCRVPVFESVGLEPLSQLYIGTEELQLARFPCVLLLEHVPKPVASRVKLMKFLWNRVLLIETRPAVRRGFNRASHYSSTHDDADDDRRGAVDSTSEARLEACRAVTTRLGSSDARCEAACAKLPQGVACLC